MYAQILAALMLIPFGLSTLMRGSDGLNAGTFGVGEAGVMSLTGAGLILSGVALLMGAAAAGGLALIGLCIITVLWVRQRLRVMGTIRSGELAGRATLVCAITLLIFAGWR
ncbi:MAG: hypothetical protein HYX51_03885 [Chloroflexi bacterium]|nr:hypothetical protein [Chloroflexota bacterium]